jgi:hypothetical protein
LAAVEHARPVRKSGSGRRERRQTEVHDADGRACLFSTRRATFFR